MALGFGSLGDVQRLSPEVESYARKIIACAQARINLPPRVLSFWLLNPQSAHVIRVRYEPKMYRGRMSTDDIHWMESHNYYWLVRSGPPRWEVEGRISSWYVHGCHSDDPKGKKGDVFDMFSVNDTTGECLTKRGQ